MHFYQFKNEWEMYDLNKDPDELSNLYGKKETMKLQNKLKQRLKNLQKSYEDESDMSVREDYMKEFRKKS